jgi:hypothetical protein
MTGTGSLEGLHDAAALWSAGQCRSEAVVSAACDALANGCDGHALAMLAGLPLRAVQARDVEDVLESALDEAGLRYYLPGSREADEAAVAVMAHQTLAGMHTPRALASWAHRMYGHDRLALAEQLAHLDDVYDTIEYTRSTVAKVDADVIAEAHRIADRMPRMR